MPHPCINAEGSTEEHRYAGTLAKEKKAFESLIQTKEHMVVCLPDNPHDLKQEQMEDNLLAMDSRSRKQLQRSDKVIVVDVREFRSILPSLLYTSMYYSQLLPRTVYVGDYILSSEICVERKGISDLFQSFASGRLYNQCEAMCKYYKFPCVLIEFQRDKAFCLVVSALHVLIFLPQHCFTPNLLLLIPLGGLGDRCGHPGGQHYLEARPAHAEFPAAALAVVSVSADQCADLPVPRCAPCLGRCAQGHDCGCMH
ncbi:hypothetical protein EON64_03245 [archaeon]|nr:MAG: hypothetical protein EON64_03245 [archaeon]